MISGTETCGDNVLRARGRQPVPGQGGENQKACTTYEFFRKTEHVLMSSSQKGRLEQTGAGQGCMNAHLKHWVLVRHAGRSH